MSRLGLGGFVKFSYTLLVLQFPAAIFYYFDLFVIYFVFQTLPSIEVVNFVFSLLLCCLHLLLKYGTEEDYVLRFGFGLRIRKDSDSRNRGFVSALEERLDNLRKKGRENLLVCLVNLQKEQEEKTG